MTIELTGPQGYDYQYLQTVYLALLFWENDGLELIVEKKDGEDAELHFVYNGITVIIETQVKSEYATLGMDSLVKWIAHFPEQQDTANLLQRIQGDPHRLALFITRSRCSDDTQNFLVPVGSVREHPRSPLLGQFADSFLDAYSKVYEESRPTPLKQRRDTYCKTHAQQLRERKVALREMSRRILIWEQVDSSSIVLEVTRLLKLRHHIPEHTSGTVISELEKTVREARDERKDVIPLMNVVLDKYSGNRAFSRPVHVIRAGSEQFFRDLTHNHVLLLTGISFCGKSHMAEWIAEQLRTSQGFTYLKENQLDAAYRYLTVASSESRVCFLEDPFGHTKLHQDAVNAWARLFALIEQLAPHRKLIVTSRKDLLQQLSGSSSPEDWSMGGSNWRDLTVNDSAYAIEVWSAYSEMKRLPESVKEVVLTGMAVGSSAVLQPGQIRHLAFSETNKLLGRSFNELSSLARVDAVQLGQSFRSRQPAELILLSVMVLGSSVGFGIIERILFKLLQAVYEDLNLSDGMMHARTFCEEMESAGYIIYVDGIWMFAHPTYYEAAMIAVETQGRFGQQRLLVILQRLLNSESVGIILSCIHNLGRIYEAYRDLRGELRRMALLALDSPYPTIRDEALVLLTTRINELSANEVEAVMKFIERYRFVDYRLEWHDGFPKLKDTSAFNYRSSLRDDRYVTEEEFHAVVKRLKTPDEASKVIPEEAWQLARALDVYGVDEENKLPLLKQLLTYKEAFIREAAAFSLLHEYGEDPKHVDLVLNDPHPLVVLQGIQGCFQGWSNWALDVRELVRKKLQEVLMIKVNCVAVHEFMTKFSMKPHGFRLDWGQMSSKEKDELIRLWGTLLPVFLQHVPDEFLEIDEAYLFEITSKSAPLLSEVQVVQITEAWVGWMDRMITHRRPSDYGMGFLDFLLEHTVHSLPYRERLAGYLLSHQDSYVVAMSLAEYVNYWPKLHPQEQTLVLSVLQSDRVDVRWLRAVALTRDNVSPEISSLLLGDPMALTLPLAVKELIAFADPGLLTDAIMVHGAENGEFYNLVGKSNDYRWPCLVLEFLKYPEHPAFPAALSYALRQVINTFAKGSFKNRVIQSCSELCKDGPKSSVTLMIEIMLRWTVRVNGADSRALWEVLYEHLNEAETLETTEKLAEVIECISLNCDLPAELLGNSAYSRLLDHHLPSDKLIWLMERNHSFPSDEFIGFLDLLLEQVPPRVHFSYEIVQSWLRDRKEEDGVSALLAKVEGLRRRLITIGSEKEKAFFYEEPLVGWVELRGDYASQTDV